MRRLVWFAIGICGGCALGVYAFGSAALIPIAITEAVLSVVLLCLHQKKAALALLGFAVGLSYTALYNSSYLSGTEAYDGKTIDATVTLTDYSRSTSYGFRAEGEITLGDKTYDVLVYHNQPGSYEPGDQLQGKFLLRLTAPGGSKETAYYQGQSVWFMAYTQGEITAISGENSALRYLPQRLRRQVLHRLESLFPKDTIAFAKALLLGETEDLSYEQDIALQISGIRHVIAVSGLHVSILFALIYLLAGKKRYLTALLGIPLLFLFALMAGLTPSILRACVMQSLMMLALFLGREYDPPSALAFAVIVILGRNPFSITSVSFQLSCGCIVGIFMFSGRFQRHFSRFTVGNRIRAKLCKWIVGSLSVTIATMIVTVPLSAYYFKTISLIGFLTNLLTLPLISVIFYGMIAALGLSFLFVPIGSIIAAGLSFLIRYVLLTAELLSKVPFAAVYTASGYILIWILLCYVLFAVFWLCGRKHMGKTACAMVLLLVVATAFSWIEPRLDDYRVTVLDVGQGQSILLQSRGETYLVDCGGSSDKNAANQAVVELRSQGITHIDGVILTHYDEDHIGGISYFLQRIQADVLYLPADRNFPFSVPAGQQLYFLSEIMTIPVGIGQITLIPGNLSAGKNNSSTCILFQVKECDILITGDRSTTGEAYLMEQYDIPQLEYLVAGHHGADSSGSYPLIVRTRPETVIISVGKNNTYGHPSEHLLQRLKMFNSRVLRTDLHGRIIIRG